MVHLQPWEDSVYRARCASRARSSRLRVRGRRDRRAARAAPADPTRGRARPSSAAGRAATGSARGCCRRACSRALGSSTRTSSCPSCAASRSATSPEHAVEALVNGGACSTRARRAGPTADPSLDITDASGSSSTIRVAWTPQPIIGGLDPPTDGYWVSGASAAARRSAGAACVRARGRRGAIIDALPAERRAHDPRPAAALHVLRAREPSTSSGSRR